MKSISEILNKSYRIIEFSNKRGFFSEQKTLKGKFLTILKTINSDKITDDSIALDSKAYLNAISKNSSDIIILNSVGIRELRALYKTSEAHQFFQRINLYNIFLITYYFVKHFATKHIRYNGIFYLRNRNKSFFYLSLIRDAADKRTRHYLSPLLKIEDFFQTLNDQNINYCVLRWFDNLPDIQQDEDVDLLVEDNDLEKLHSIIDDCPGIIPFDIYSKSGKPGSDFQNLPYYTLSLSEKSLNETVLFRDRFKVPTYDNYFYLLSYHAVFHKGENSGLASKKFDLKISSNPDHDYLLHLKLIASQANISVQEFTLDGLHMLLESAGFAPRIDTLYKLSISNQYLKAYLKHYQKDSNIQTKFEGLVCFVARERIIEKNLLNDLVKYIQKEGFTILRVNQLKDPFKSDFTKHVRGGNWNQGRWPVSGGPPSVIIVALDVYPIEQEESDYQKHPGLTNRRIINKNEIRDFINNKLESTEEWFNGVHSSDNEIQALDYLSLAGINENEIYREIVNHKQSFVTHYPVISVLSQYSKRAKVEVIDFHGVKAVKKTFKPNCEIFLENEIKMYSLFQNILPIPELLEAGHNYIITSYIDGSRHLRHRVNIKTLKKCLNIVRQVHDAGYSLLDFKPGNFLIDRNNKIYLVDFEFLYKYDTIPDFLESFDLVGASKKINSSLLPTYFIPDDLKQFDILWYNNTGIKYIELSDLDRPLLKIKSFYRYYILRINNRLSKIERIAKSVIKNLYRHLP